MTNNDDRGGWQPVPQGGDYDAEATAFVQLPEGIDLDGAPLAAPGHGFVPPMIRPLTPAAGTDPAGPGAWSLPQTARWPESQQPAAPGPAQDVPAETMPDSAYGHDPATGQWFSDTGGPAGPDGIGYPAASGEPPQSGGDLTGQWTIPAADGDAPDESGEYSTSSLLRPATLPGGAPAPWALPQEPAPVTEPVPEPEPAGAAGENTGTTETRAAETRAAEPRAAESRPEDARPDDTAAGAPQDNSTPPGGTRVPHHEPEPVQDPGAELPPEPEPEPEPEPVLTHSQHTPASYVLRVNGSDRPVTDAWIGESLLYVLRERLGLAGAKDGCSQGECGACNVQVDGRLVASCLVPAATAAGTEVRTVEGLAVDGEPSDVQRALSECGAVQCGFCIPGMAMTMHDLLEGNHAPTELETRQALSGNLCRCTGYRGVLDAVGEVVAGRAAAAVAVGEARIPHQASPGAGGVQPPNPQQHDGGMA